MSSPVLLLVNSCSLPDGSITFFLLLKDYKKFLKIDFSIVAEKRGDLYPKVIILDDFGEYIF